MSEYFPDFLRAAVSTTANVLLMMLLLQPKYSKKITLLTMLGILASDLGTAIYLPKRYCFCELIYKIENGVFGVRILV